MGWDWILQLIRKARNPPARGQEGFGEQLYVALA